MEGSYTFLCMKVCHSFSPNPILRNSSNCLLLYWKEERGTDQITQHKEWTREVEDDIRMQRVLWLYSWGSTRHAFVRCRAKLLAPSESPCWWLPISCDWPPTKSVMKVIIRNKKVKKKKQKKKKKRKGKRKRKEVDLQIPWQEKQS